MNRMIGGYQLREAAGVYWLIDMEQSGREWIRPIRLNETGAKLVIGLGEGRLPAELARDLAAEYGCGEEEALRDTDEFCAMLAAHGIRIARKADL